MLVCSLSMMSRKMVARDVFDTFGTRSGPVYDDTNAGHKMERKAIVCVYF